MLTLSCSSERVFPDLWNDHELLDCILIRSLLNGGIDTFTEKFHLPPHCERNRGMVYHIQNGWEDANDLKSDFQSYSNILFGSFNEGNHRNPLNDPNHIDDLLTMTDESWGSFPFGEILGNLPSNTNEIYLSTMLIQVLYENAHVCNLDTISQQMITYNLHSLLTHSSISRFVEMYFMFWHHNFQLIHRPTFDVDSVSPILLISVIIMGALYSSDGDEVSAARRLLDVAELSVFSTELFTGELSRSFDREGSANNNSEVQSRLEGLQAGVIMTIAQYWAGSRSSRNRAMETRFGEICRVSYQPVIQEQY